MRLARLYFAALLFLIGSWLLGQVSWRAVAGVFLFVWGNNLVYSWQLAQKVRPEVWKR